MTREVNGHRFESRTTGVYEMTSTTYTCQNDGCDMSGGAWILTIAKDVSCPATKVEDGNDWVEV